MREIKVDNDGVVPILDTKKLYVMEVNFRDVLSGRLLPGLYYYICTKENNGTVRFVNNSTKRDTGFVSDSIQESVRMALVARHSHYSSKVYEFNNVQEFEKEKNVKLCVGIKN